VQKASGVSVVGDEQDIAQAQAIQDGEAWLREHESPLRDDLKQAISIIEKQQYEPSTYDKRILHIFRNRR
jgi:hypothetical protein